MLSETKKYKNVSENYCAFIIFLLINSLSVVFIFSVSLNKATHSFKFKLYIYPLIIY